MAAGKAVEGRRQLWAASLHGVRCEQVVGEMMSGGHHHGGGWGGDGGMGGGGDMGFEADM